MAEKDAPKDKMIKSTDSVQKEEAILREYFVPEYQVTVQATSLQEALAKAKQVRDNKDNKQNI